MMSIKKTYFNRFILILFLGLVASSCAPYHARHKPIKYQAIGIASWYGPGFHGKRTASGEYFRQSALTAAHRTLPFGTSVKVTNLANNKSIVVRINDRGPYYSNRLIDLSYAAAKKIGLLATGTAKVKVVSVNVETPQQIREKRIAYRDSSSKKKIYSYRHSNNGQKMEEIEDVSENNF